MDPPPCAQYSINSVFLGAAVTLLDYTTHFFYNDYVFSYFLNFHILSGSYVYLLVVHPPLPKSGLQMGKNGCRGPRQNPLFPSLPRTPPLKIVSIPDWLGQSHDSCCRPRHVRAMWPPFMAPVIKLMTSCLQGGGSDGEEDNTTQQYIQDRFPGYFRLGTL